MSFTNYVAQSPIFSAILFWFGWFDRIGAATTFVLGAAVYAGQIVVSARWLRRYGYGPIERLWRRLTYGATLPLAARREVGAAGLAAVN